MINRHHLELEDNYLFSEIDRRVEAHQRTHPGVKLLRLGIGDVTRPLPSAVVNAIKCAAEEMGAEATFHGYGPYQGYAFLREAVSDYYGERGVTIPADDIFISDGAKSDLGNFPDLFSRDCRVLIPDPVYPVYVDTNRMAGRPLAFLRATLKNGFLPMPDSEMDADLIYLCSPNNPTGAVYSRDELAEWVDYALARNAVILFDAAYEAFVRGEGLARSIYEIEGAEQCAVEFCSFSKTAGFTGMRCGYTVVPHALVRDGQLLQKLWLRRQSTKFNGVPYIVQRAAASVFTPEGRQGVEESIDYYRDNARLLTDALDRLGVWYTGGTNSPYLWLRCPNGETSWECFQRLLAQANIVGTPGSGFGENGEGYFRLTAFGSREDTAEAARRLGTLWG